MHPTMACMALHKVASRGMLESQKTLQAGCADPVFDGVVNVAALWDKDKSVKAS